MNWNETHEDPPAGGAPDPAAAAAAAAQGGQGNPPSLLQQGQGNDWLPEKFRTLKDGTQDLDLEASARKLAESYSHLEKAKPGAVTLPKTAAEYKIEGLSADIKLDEVMADPLFKGVLEKAHAAGIGNEAVNFFMQQYFNEIAPGLLKADVQLSADEAKAALGKVWGDEAAMSKNLGMASRAIKAFGAEGDVPGGLDRLLSKYGNDPDFLAFAARVGAEVQEGAPITDGSAAAGDWESQVNAIKANPAYADASHPQHKQLHDQMTALYQKRYGQRTQQLGGTAVR